MKPQYRRVSVKGWEPGMGTSPVVSKLEQRVKELEIRAMNLQATLLKTEARLAEAQEELRDQTLRAELAEKLVADSRDVTELLKVEDEKRDLRAKLTELEGTLQTESAERIRCRDGWAKAEALLAKVKDELTTRRTYSQDCPYCSEFVMARRKLSDALAAAQPEEESR